MLTHPALLLVDEIVYLPMNQDGAALFFPLINTWHERTSTVLTSNKGFEDWGGALGDEVMAAAPIERLVHHCHIVNIRGNSYRMKDHQNLLQAARIDAAREPRHERRADGEQERCAPPGVNNWVVLPDSSPVAASTRFPPVPPSPTPSTPCLGKRKARSERFSVRIDTSSLPIIDSDSPGASVLEAKVRLSSGAARNLSTILRHRRFLFTDSLLLLWK